VCRIGLPDLAQVDLAQVDGTEILKG